MSIEKSEALILRCIPFRDTSKVVTAYTAEHGLVSLLAKGVRSAKPRFGAALEIFASVDLVYYAKESRELQLLSQATLLDPHLGLGAEADRYAYGTGVLEFLMKVLAGQEPPGRLYPLSIRTLEVLEACSRAAMSAVFRAFELKAVSFLGHRPELYRCVECGRQLEDGERVTFSPLPGGVVCRDCDGGAGGLEISPAMLSWLRRLLTATLDEVAAEPPSAAVLARLGGVMEAFLQAHLERYERLRSLRMVAALALAGQGASASAP